MRENSKDIELGKFISLILRHNTQTVNITLDEHGWANVEDLINGICRTGKKIDFITLERIVNENNKQRDSFNENKTSLTYNNGKFISRLNGYFGNKMIEFDEVAKIEDDRPYIELYTKEVAELRKQMGK